MILQDKVSVKIVPNTAKYWKEMGYDFQVWDTVEINVEHLPKKSNVYVDCRCDNCGKDYSQRVSRNTDICGKCVNSMRMKNNKNGKSNLKYETVPKDELIELINSGKSKTDIANIYSVSITTVNKWLDENGIVLSKYHGKKYFKTQDEEDNAIKKISSYGEDIGVSELSRIVKIPRHIINQLRKDDKIKVNTQFDVWKKSYEEIISNMDFYVKENYKKTLKTISDENEISIEQLKKAFSELNIPVKLHSYNKSKGEIECRDYIISLNENCYSAMIDKTFEIDCYVPSKKFGVEYCGEFWHRFIPKKNNKNYHKKKYIESSKRGIQIMTIFESEWILKKEIVKSMIRSRLGKNEKIFARKCVVSQIVKSEAEKFHNSNHISGSTNSSVNIGLFYEGKLMSVLSFIKSRYCKKHEYEISRFSTLCGYTIVGGLGKMFSYFVEKFNPKSCMTYSDLRFGEGKCYEKIGFEFLGNTPPNYFYYHKNKGYIESRMRYQKHMLKDMKNYLPGLTEFEIMDSEGYYRIYDCGNKKYGWKNPTHI